MPGDRFCDHGCLDWLDLWNMSGNWDGKNCMGTNIGHVALFSAVVGIGAFVYVVAFEPMDESENPRAGAIDRVASRQQMIGRIRQGMVQKQPTAVDRAATNLLKNHPEDPEVLFYRAIADRYLGNTENEAAHWRMLDGFLEGLVDWPGRFTALRLDYFRAWAKRGVGDIEESEVIFARMADSLEASLARPDERRLSRVFNAYNLACYRAMSGQTELAIGHWEMVVVSGYQPDGGWWMIDPDLESLHSDDRFWAIGAMIDGPARQSDRLDPSESGSDEELSPGLDTDG
jgi:hypothetical protein